MDLSRIKTEIVEPNGECQSPNQVDFTSSVISCGISGTTPVTLGSIKQECEEENRNEPRILFGLEKDHVSMNRSGQSPEGSESVGPKDMDTFSMDDLDDIVDLVDSEEEDQNDPNAAPQMEQQTQRPQQTEGSAPSKCPDSTSEEYLSQRVLHYKVKFGKLRYLYDRMKKDLGYQKQCRGLMAKEITRLKAQTANKTEEALELQSKIMKKDSMLELMQGRVWTLEKEMEIVKVEKPSIVELRRQNLAMAQRVAVLEETLKTVHTEQMATLNLHKECLHRSQQAYKQLFGENRAESQVPANSSSLPPPSQWPSDPRLAERKY